MAAPRAKKKRGRPKQYPPRHLLPIRMDNDFYRRLKKYAAEHERTVTEIVLEAIEAWWKARSEER